MSGAGGVPPYNFFFEKVSGDDLLVILFDGSPLGESEERNFRLYANNADCPSSFSSVYRVKFVDAVNTEAFSGNITCDLVNDNGNVTPTPSPTPTITPSITPTRTATPTPTVSITPSITPTTGISPTPSITPTITPSRTPTISVTPSITPTITPSRTPTISITPSITPSRTPTLSVTPTRTRTPTPTPSITPSPSGFNFTASLNNTSLSGFNFGCSGNAEVTTSQSTTCTPSGGTAPYTYLWEYVSGNSFTVDNPTSATTTFSFNMSCNSTRTGVYRCKVTDNNGNIAYSNNVTVELSNEP